MIKEALDCLQFYMEQQEFRGYDPYDWLQSPFFNHLPHKARFVLQQIGRRSPINIRNILRIPKGYNPVTLGLSIQAYAYRARFDEGMSDKYFGTIKHLLEDLIRFKSNGFNGVCWGYDFDWAARYTSIPAFTPNIVATGIISHALYEANLILNDSKVKELIKKAGSFVINDLNRTIQENSICFSYSTNDKQQVLNASMKAVRLLSENYALFGEDRYKELAKKGTLFLLENQKNDGSWPYAVNDARTWVDNYHTGYILDCLDAYRLLCEDESVKPALEKGLTYYSQTFFYSGKIPKFRNDRVYPVDTSGVAQSILTLTRFGMLDKAMDVARYAISEMQHKKGYFFFRKYKYFNNTISYMRWSNAWMFAALSYLLLQTGNKYDIE